MTRPPSAETPAPGTAPAPTSWWRRRVLAPILAQLTQGVTPDKIAATLAVGTACSLFPFLGFTTGLNLAVGTWLRMNHPILQLVNYLLTPIHLAMILVYVRVGETIWRSGSEPFSVGDVITTFREASIGEFLARFGWAGVHAFTAWIISVPIIIALLYYPLRPVLRRFAQKSTSGRTPPTPV